MVRRTEQNPVIDIGGTVRLPRLDMVCVAPGWWRRAAWPDTTSVAHGKGSSLRWREEPFSSSLVERLAFGSEYCDAQPGVAHHLLNDRSRNGLKLAIEPTSPDAAREFREADHGGDAPGRAQVSLRIARLAHSGLDHPEQNVETLLLQCSRIDHCSRIHRCSRVHQGASLAIRYFAIPHTDTQYTGA